MTQTAPAGRGLIDLESGHPAVHIGMVRRILQARTSFSFYPYQCMTSSAPGTAPSTSLWPCPPPYGWEHGHPDPALSGRARSRWHRRKLEEQTVNLIVVALSYLHAGSKRYCPEAGRSGMALNAVQQSAVDHFRDLARLWCRPPTH